MSPDEIVLVEELASYALLAFLALLTFLIR